MYDANFVGEQVSEEVKPTSDRKRRSRQRVTQPIQKRFIGMEECAQYLGITKGTLYVWVFLKKIPYVKMGRLVKFDLIAIEAWLKERTIKNI